MKPVNALSHNSTANQASVSNNEGASSLGRRKFLANCASAATVLAIGSSVGRSLDASTLVPPTRPSSVNETSALKRKIPLGFDNFSIRALNWKADQLIEFAAEQEMDSLLLSDLDVYESFEPAYLASLKTKADEAGIQLHAGTGSICPTAARFTDKWGNAHELLELGIKVAQSIGSPVFRCYLGGEQDRKTDGGIQKHIDRTVEVLRKVKARAVDANVKIAVENHAGDMQGWELVGLIEAAGSDFVGATIDSGNATWTLEHPIGNLEILGKYALSAGMRDSVVWETEEGCRVAWTAIGEGQVDWKAYAAKYAELCPGVPFQLEIISGFNKAFNYKQDEFWATYPNAKARDFERFLTLARAGEAVADGQPNDGKYQLAELKRSITYCKSELGMGLK